MGVMSPLLRGEDVEACKQLFSNCLHFRGMSRMSCVWDVFKNTMLIRLALIVGSRYFEGETLKLTLTENEQQKKSTFSPKILKNMLIFV